ncbi:MAG: hypothetical protein JRD92_05905 [Deltaproteobacteria bacterium]|nr:hypothetical protein [Deltaproteobacteria bacterium]
MAGDFGAEDTRAAVERHRDVEHSERVRHRKSLIVAAAEHCDVPGLDGSVFDLRVRLEQERDLVRDDRRHCRRETTLELVSFEKDDFHGRVQAGPAFLVEGDRFVHVDSIEH